MSTSLDPTLSKKKKTSSTTTTSSKMISSTNSQKINLINENELHDLLMKNSLPNPPVMYYFHRTNGILDNKFILGNSYFMKTIIQPLHPIIKSWTNEGRKHGSMSQIIDNYLKNNGISSIEMYSYFSTGSDKQKMYLKLSKVNIDEVLTSYFQGTNSSHRVLHNIQRATQSIKLYSLDVSVFNYFYLIL